MSGKRCLISVTLTFQLKSLKFAIYNNVLDGSKRFITLQFFLSFSSHNRNHYVMNTLYTRIIHLCFEIMCWSRVRYNVMALCVCIVRHTQTKHYILTRSRRIAKHTFRQPFENHLKTMTFYVTKKTVECLKKLFQTGFGSLKCSYQTRFDCLGLWREEKPNKSVVSRTLVYQVDYVSFTQVTYYCRSTRCHCIRHKRL